MPIDAMSHVGPSRHLAALQNLVAIEASRTLASRALADLSVHGLVPITYIITKGEEYNKREGGFSRKSKKWLCRSGFFENLGKAIGYKLYPIGGVYWVQIVPNSLPASKRQWHLDQRGLRRSLRDDRDQARLLQLAQLGPQPLPVG